MTSTSHNLPIIFKFLPQSGTKRTLVMDWTLKAAYTTGIDVGGCVIRVLVPAYMGHMILHNDTQFRDEYLNSLRKSSACGTASTHYLNRASKVDKELDTFEVGKWDVSANTWSTNATFAGLVWFALAMASLSAAAKTYEYGWRMWKMNGNDTFKPYDGVIGRTLMWAGRGSTWVADVIISSFIVYVLFMENVIAACPLFDPGSATVHSLHWVVTLYCLHPFLTYGYDMYLADETDAQSAKTNSVLIPAIAPSEKRGAVSTNNPLYYSSAA